MSTDDTAALIDVLERSRGLGFLGPGPVEAHIEHAARYGAAIEQYRRHPGGPAPEGQTDPVVATGIEGGGRVRVVDLGAGGGVPSLPMIVADHDLEVLLVDASQRRLSFCAWAIAELAATNRAEIMVARAEELPGRGYAESFDVAVARGFGPPASTLECAAPLVRVGGWCVISEPPDGRPWPTSVPELGLEQRPGPEGVVVFERTGPVGDGHPRSAKQQKRAPLFEL